jgi:hypothetical protein
LTIADYYKIGSNVPPTKRMIPAPAKTIAASKTYDIVVNFGSATVDSTEFDIDVVLFYLQRVDDYNHIYQHIYG